MLVFIDESGDPGFKLAAGSSPFFVMAMVIFDDHAAAAAAQTAISRLQGVLRVRPEFKFNKLDYERRDRFFEEVSPFPFRTRSIVVRKEVIYSRALQTNKDSFYKFFIRNMMQHDGGALVDAKVVIDGSGDREFKRTFRSYVRKHIPANCVREVELKDSVKDPLVQLADMCVGAIARSYREDRNDSDRWLRALRLSGKIDNTWEFE